MIDQATCTFIRQHLKDNPANLALQAGRYPLVNMPQAVTQIAALQIAEAKLPTWYRTEGIVFPPHLPMEQCSSELTARHKASLVKGKSLVDLTGGFGIDCYFLSQHFEHTDYVERQEELCRLATHNYARLNAANISVHHSDSIAFLQNISEVDCIFIDPARRNAQGGKVVALADCEPNVVQLEETMLQKAKQVLIKLSPMLDLSLACQELKHIAAVHVISVNNECKELLIELQRTAPERSVIFHATQLFTNGKGAKSVSFTREEEQQAVCPLTTEVKKYLYEPNTSLLKAGAYKLLGARYGLEKLHPSSHLYTSDTLLTDFPGRCFEVEKTAGFGKKELKEGLEGISQANLTIRNFPGSVNELRKRLKLKEGGATYLFATTLADERKVLIKTKKADTI